MEPNISVFEKTTVPRNMLDLYISSYQIDLAEGSNSEHPLPDCQGSHDVSWLHSDCEKDCGLKIPLTSTANF